MGVHDFRRFKVFDGKRVLMVSEKKIFKIHKKSSKTIALNHRLIKIHQKLSGYIKNHQNLFKFITNHQKPSISIRNHQNP